MSAVRDGAMADGPAGEVERRGRRARSIVLLVYAGLPSVFLALTAWMSSVAPSAAGDQAALLPLGLLLVGLLLVGLLLRRSHRFKPARWSGTGTMMGSTGAASTAFTGLPVIGLDGAWATLLVLPTAVVGGLAGFVLGRFARRALLVPLVAELADSPYELVFRLRGPMPVRLTVGSAELSVTAGPRRPGGTVPPGTGATFELSTIRGATETGLTGLERLKFPADLRLTPINTPGQAVILQTPSDHWVLPLDEAATIAQIVNRRVAAATP